MILTTQGRPIGWTPLCIWPFLPAGQRSVNLLHQIVLYPHLLDLIELGL